MENCLVTRLRASVNNPYLPTLNSAKIIIKDFAVGSTAKLRIGALNENDVRLSIPSGVTLTNGTTVLEGDCYLPKDNTGPTAWDIYDVSNTSGSDQIMDLIGISKLKTFGSTSPATGIVISALDIESTYNTSLVAVLVSEEPNVYGNFEIFGDIASLKYFHATATPVRGDLLKFISTAVKSNRTSGSINMNLLATIGTVSEERIQGEVSWQPSGNNYQVTYKLRGETDSRTCTMDIDGNLVL